MDNRYAIQKIRRVYLQEKHSALLESLQLGFEMGWATLVDELLSEIVSYVERAGCARSNIKVSGIESRSGALYCSVTAPLEVMAGIEDILARYRARSMLTCEACGDAGKVRHISANNVQTLCEMHSRERVFQPRLPLTAISHRAS